MASERIWGGTTLEARREERRRALLDAGFALMGEGGVPAVTVRGACRATKLSERYFYESFDDRDALILAVYDETVEQARAEIVAAASELDDVAAAARATMDAYMRFLEEDPRRARILLREPLSYEQLGHRRVALLPVFAHELHARLADVPGGPDATDAALTSAAVVGAVIMLFLGYLEGALDVDRERVIDHAAAVLTRTWSIRTGD